MYLSMYLPDSAFHFCYCLSYLVFYYLPFVLFYGLLTAHPVSQNPDITLPSMFIEYLLHIGYYA